MSDSDSSSSNSGKEEGNSSEIATDGYHINKIGRARSAIQHRRNMERDDVDGANKEKPKKGTKDKRIDVENLKSGDHIYVGAYISDFLGGKKMRESRIKLGHLWKHHFLIGHIQNSDNAEILERTFDVYEFTAVKMGSLKEEIANADTRKLSVVARKPKEKGEQWTFSHRDFYKYYKRRLNRYNHEEYMTDPASIGLSIQRAESACQSTFKGKYDMTDFNCEHFVTFCKGLGGPRGYCYMFKTFGNKSFSEQSLPGSVAVDCDEAETDTLAGDIQATDDDDDKISIIDSNPEPSVQ